MNSTKLSETVKDWYYNFFDSFEPDKQVIADIHNIDYRRKDDIFVIDVRGRGWSSFICFYMFLYKSYAFFLKDIAYLGTKENTLGGFMQFSKEPLGSDPKGNAGFTLVELAIVLVVIGLIIAAVLKGEDLIQNARMLNFVSNPVRVAQTSAMSYYDRTGQFPVGSGSNGPLYQMYQTGINSVLDLKNPFTAGSDSLGMALGTIQVTDSSGNTANYAVILIEPVIVPASGGTPIATNWTNSELGYANYLKSKIDGSTSSWTTRSVRMISIGNLISYKSLQSEINTQTTSTYDGYFPSTDLIKSSQFVDVNTNTTNIIGSPNYTLVYFYNQQPH
jgi:prepilin-type N-terminal cleavage/methylation domain-containing protein